MASLFLKPSPIYAKRCEASVIFAFREAEPPLVWRYDLARDPCFTLTARDSDSRCEIGFIQSDGAFSKIASFPERELAEAALLKIARVVGAPFIRWGRVLLLSIVLALTAFTAAAILSGSGAKAGLAPDASFLSAVTSQFPSLPPILGGGNALRQGITSNGGFPNLSGAQDASSYVGESQQPRYVLTPTAKAAHHDPHQTGVPVDADEYLRTVGSEP